MVKPATIVAIFRRHPVLVSSLALTTAIAVFFAIAQIVGAMGPVFFGWLIGNGENPERLLIGYLVGAGVMAVGGIVEIAIGVNAERRSLEDVANPLSTAPVEVDGG